jgi:DNA-binding LacI/PurR family transcriptional regulator
MLRDRIESGFYPPGCKLPKEVDLAAELNVARITLRPALELLEIENFIIRAKGIGTFVREKLDEKIRVMVVSSSPLDNSYRISNPFLYLMPYLQAAAMRMNIKIDICDAKSLLISDAAQCAARIRENGIRGIFLLDSGFTGYEKLLTTLRAAKLPVLLPHAYLEDVANTGFSVMGTNYAELMKDGLKYFAVQGHQRVGSICYTSMRGISPEDYFQWVRSSFLDPDPALLQLIPAYDDGEQVDRALAALLSLPEPPTAILSYSDFFSIQIYQYLRKHKIRIPDDIAVLTIGGQIGCDLLDPPLSALEYGDQEIAETAVRIMLEMIHNQRKLDFIVTPHRLTVRKSTQKVILHKNKIEHKQEKTK